VARLEGRLAKLGGGGRGGGPSRRDLIDAMAGARQLHTHSLLSGADRLPPPPEGEDIPPAVPFRGILKPEVDSVFTAFLAKVAPDKLALSQEELASLLLADQLAQSRAAEDSEDQSKGDQQQNVKPSENQSDVFKEIDKDLPDALSSVRLSEDKK